MKFTIYGSTQEKCQQLTRNAEEAAKALGFAYQIEEVTDVNRIVDAGVMSAPAVSIDGEMMFEGKVASVDEIIDRLT